MVLYLLSILTSLLQHYSLYLNNSIKKDSEGQVKVEGVLIMYDAMMAGLVIVLFAAALAFANACLTLK